MSYDRAVAEVAQEWSIAGWRRAGDAVIFIVCLDVIRAVRRVRTHHWQQLANGKFRYDSERVRELEDLYVGRRLNAADAGVGEKWPRRGWMPVADRFVGNLPAGSRQLQVPPVTLPEVLARHDAEIAAAVAGSAAPKPAVAPAQLAG